MCVNSEPGCLAPGEAGALAGVGLTPARACGHEPLELVVLVDVVPESLPVCRCACPRSLAAAVTHWL